MTSLPMIVEESGSEHEELLDEEASFPMLLTNNHPVGDTRPSVTEPLIPLFTPYPALAVENFLTDDDGASLLDETYHEQSAASETLSASWLGQISSRVFRGASANSVDSVAGHFSEKLGQRTLKLSQFCELIAKCASLERAKILTVECYKEWSFYGIMHRTLVFHLRREGRTDVWLRVDRRRSHNVSGVQFVRRGGKTVANDVVHLAGAISNLLRRPTPKPENRMTFELPPNLGAFRFCLQVICEELSEYHIWPENCWFMCSLLQEHLFDSGKGSFERGSHIRLELAPSIRLRVRNKVWHLVPFASESALIDSGRQDGDLFAPPGDGGMRWKTIDGGLDTRDFDFAALEDCVSGLVHTVQQYHVIMSTDPSRHDLRALIIELLRRSLSLEFILLQRLPSPRSSRVMAFLSANPTYISSYTDFPPLRLLFLKVRRQFDQTIPEVSWRIDYRQLARAIWSLSKTHVAAAHAYATEARSIIATHSEGGRHWTSGQMLEGHVRVVNCVAFSPDGKQIASASHDETICLWDPVTGERIGEPMRGHTDWVSAVAFSPDGAQIVSGSYDNTLRRWDVSSGEPIGISMEGHAGYVLSVACSSDGKFIVSGSADGTIRRWDASTSEAVSKPLEGHTGSVLSVTFSPDGKRIVSGSWDQTIRLWDTITGAAVGEAWKGHTSRVFSVAFSPDCRFIVSGSFDNTVRRWDALTGESIGSPMIGHTDAIKCVVVSPGGKQIASASDDRTIRIWDADTGEAIGGPLEGHVDWVRSVAFSPDDRQIVSCSYDNTVRIWDSLEDAVYWTES